jgi:hypothetical protein
MKRFGITVLAALGTVALGAAASAEDSVKLFDTSDLNYYTNAPSIQVGSTTTSMSLEQNILGKEVSLSNSMISLTSPKTNKTGFSFGVEVSLDESETIKLQDTNRLYVEGSFGRVDAFESLAAQSSTGMLPSIFNGETGVSSISLLARAASLNVDSVQMSLSTSYPGMMTPSYAGVSVGYSSGSRSFADPRDRGFEISLTSMVMVQDTTADSLSFLEAASVGTDERAYNIGLNVGYRGFTFVASFLRGEGQIDSTYESYDVGVQYDFGSWATSLAVGGYFGDDSPTSYANLLNIERIYSVEIGASYAIRPWLSVEGRFQFFDYRTLLGSSLDGLGGTVYLGTSLGF